MRIIYHNIKYGILTILWMALIWVLSSQSHLNFGLLEFWNVLFMKAAHIFVYTILGILLVKLLLGYKDWKKTDEKFTFAGLLLLIFFIGSLYSILDELHQSFVPGRTASIIDIGIDIVGLFFGLTWGLRLATNKLRTSVKVLLTK
jgi:VanZ family protein